MSKDIVVNFVSRRIEHHSRYSGYQRLMEFIPNSRTVDSTILPRLFQLVDNRVFHSVIWRVAGVRYYSPQAFLAEVAAIRLAQRTSGQIFHFVWGDDMYRFAGVLKRLLCADARLICTFHQPPSYLLRFIRSLRHLEYLDAVVIVGHNQYGVVSNYVDGEKIFFVPHGVDTDFFHPHEGNKPGEDNFVCITVGQWLRDFDTLRRVIRIVNMERIAMQFVVVTQPGNFHFFQDCIGVECKSGIDDFSLRGLYERADVLLLPFLDCTANNSLLEGMACGLPVVVTDVGGSRDYVDDSCACLLYTSPSPRDS